MSMPLLYSRDIATKVYVFNIGDEVTVEKIEHPVLLKTYASVSKLLKPDEYARMIVEKYPILNDLTITKSSLEKFLARTIRVDGTWRTDTQIGLSDKLNHEWDLLSGSIARFIRNLDAKKNFESLLIQKEIIPIQVSEVGSVNKVKLNYIAYDKCMGAIHINIFLVSEQYDMEIYSYVSYVRLLGYILAKIVGAKKVFVYFDNKHFSVETKV